ncbi:nicotinate phosphoribosyltransferase [Salmonella phage GSP193]|uniref:Nicotinate phosphoribosyltransferase n=1 Tax=Salmonella phage GSP193 TaxID=2962601 RepID=A0AAX3C1T6_9CAUD|nr:nicotinate phosphoribosyltransferase [Salmonella phage GSP193]
MSKSLYAVPAGLNADAYKASHISVSRCYAISYVEPDTT